jgi:mRNA-degrading endonuclease RelE of RelBE toxin-antitoxin system
METDRSPVKVFESDEFRKDIKRLGKRYRSVKQDIRSLVAQLRDGETPGDRISGNKYPVYKVRVKNSDLKRGQSAGYRVIYYIQTLETILLTNIYSKADRADISNQEVEEVIDRYELEVERQKVEETISQSEDLEDEDRSSL